MSQHGGLFLELISGDIIILNKCTKNWDIIYTAPEIRCVMDVIIFHFGLFLTFYPPNSPKNQNSTKEKKRMSCDIIILQKCAKNMLYCSWDMVHDRWYCYFSFWAIFYPSTPPHSPRNQIKKKKEKIMPGDINLHLCTKNYDHMMYGSWYAAKKLDRGQINGRKSDILRWVPFLITKTTVKIHLCIYFCKIWAEQRVFQVLLQNLSNPKNIALRFAWPSNFF